MVCGVSSGRVVVNVFGVSYSFFSKTKMKKLLVPGGAGFIGSQFVRQQVAKGHRVTVLDALTYAGHRENLEGVQGVELVAGDIRDGKLVAGLVQRVKPDWIVNFAAESHVDRSIDGPSVFIETNVLGTGVLLHSALHYWKELKGSIKDDFRFLQVSTDEVFGTLGDTGYFTEATPLAPNSPYSASKAGADFLVRAWHHTYGLPTLLTHCSNNYGPRQFPEKLIPTMVRCALQGEGLPVYGNGKNVRDWIHVEDHCSGIELVLARGKPGSSYCFGGRAERCNLEVVEAICSELDRIQPRADRKSYREQLQFVTDRLGHDWRYAIDDSASERELGFQRKYDFGQGLRETVRWYVENESWCAAVLKNAKARSEKGHR